MIRECRRPIFFNESQIFHKNLKVLNKIKQTLENTHMR